MPQCLEILLLSPHHQQWVKRIRYVIFDEVCYLSLSLSQLNSFMYIYKICNSCTLVKMVIIWIVIKINTRFMKGVCAHGNRFGRRWNGKTERNSRLRVLVTEKKYSKNHWTHQ